MLFLEQDQPLEFLAEREDQLALLKEIAKLDAKTKDSFSLVFEAARAIDPDFKLNNSSLRMILDLVKDFFQTSHELTGHLIDEAERLTKIFKDEVPGCVAVFGVGFPFYSIDETGEPIDVPEIASYLDLIGGLLENQSSQNPEGWPCPACQKINKLPTIRHHCKPCNLTPLKPRDIMKAIPDLDLVVIVDNPDLQTESIVQNILKREGYTQSNNNILESLVEAETSIFLTSIGRKAKSKVPIDPHIWSLEEYERCAKKLILGESDIKIKSRSLHDEWEGFEMNFWFDFVFSFFCLSGSDEGFRGNLTFLRKMFTESTDVDEIISNVVASSPRAGRLLEDAGIREILRDKLLSWENKNG